MIFKNCNIEGSVTAMEGVGGIVGYCKGTIEECSATAKILADDIPRSGDIYVGGIAGYCYTVRNCFATGSVGQGDDNSCNLYIGGIIGSGRVITNCYANTTVAVKERVSAACAGGIAGKAFNVTNSFSVGKISALYIGSNIGRIVGYLEISSCTTNCYADSLQTITIGKANSEVVNANTMNSNEMLQSTNTLQSEDFIYNTLGWSSDIWQINEGGFPTLK